jgi:hypothetical protein
MTTPNHTGEMSKRTHKLPIRELTIHIVIALVTLVLLAVDIVKADPALTSGEMLPFKIIAGRVAPH